MPSTDPTYHNNSKYYAEQAAGSATAAAGSAATAEAAAALAETVSEDLEEITCFRVDTGVISSLPKVITDSRITVQHVVLDMIPDENVDIGWVCQPGKIILYGSLPTGTTIPSPKLRVLKCIGETQDAVTLTLREQTSTGANGNYLVAEATGLTPGVQYTWRIYSVAGGVETYVYSIGATTGYPNATRWFSEVERSLTDGTVYLCKICPTADSSDLTTSNTVTFVGGAITPEPAEPEESETDPEEESDPEET